MLADLSVERLEQEIASYYWRGAKIAPGVKIKEVGVLKELWEEFDRRAELDELDEEEW